MHAVTSADGTELGYETHGDGQPLVLVHGTSARKESFRDLVPHLADDFEVVTYDRRGRGRSSASEQREDAEQASGEGRSLSNHSSGQRPREDGGAASSDSDEYRFEREVEDLRAVVESVGDAPIVLGHSFGGLVALEAAAGLDIDRLVLYEPSILVGEHHDGDLAERIRARLADGDRVDAVEVFLDAVGAADLLPQPAVAQAAGIVGTVAREIEVVEDYDLDDPETGVPTLLVLGEQGPEHLREGVEVLDSALAETERAELAGVGHLGINTAPEQLADAVHEFARG
ncbi:alpha/beta fold hydrolase [Halobacterium noricense]|uniref:alpha/beta fold hydrolase n=1 Tax=Halobacterium noricense TaxID=223182 RepID=UPI001E3D7E19|nr:alpha/beta hydrolase [Halobacterium noricense]UHH25471.1 alpha/beta hydrolase [Halobacterium noricense]